MFLSIFMIHLWSARHVGKCHYGFPIPFKIISPIDVYKYLMRIRNGQGALPCPTLPSHSYQTLSHPHTKPGTWLKLFSSPFMFHTCLKGKSYLTSDMQWQEFWGSWNCIAVLLSKSIIFFWWPCRLEVGISQKGRLSHRWSRSLVICHMPRTQLYAYQKSQEVFGG